MDYKRSKAGPGDGAATRSSMAVPLESFGAIHLGQRQTEAGEGTVTGKLGVW